MIADSTEYTSAHHRRYKFTIRSRPLIAASCYAQGEMQFEVSLSSTSTLRAFEGGLMVPLWPTLTWHNNYVVIKKHMLNDPSADPRKCCLMAYVLIEWDPQALHTSFAISNVRGTGSGRSLTTLNREGPWHASSRTMLLLLEVRASTPFLSTSHAFSTTVLCFMSVSNRDHSANSVLTDWP